MLFQIEVTQEVSYGRRHLTCIFKPIFGYISKKKTFNLKKKRKKKEENTQARDYQKYTQTRMK